MNKYRFINSTGIEIPYLPISMEKVQDLQLKIKKKYANEPLEPPTREFEVIGGGKQKEVLDDTNVVSDEDKELLAKHKDALHRLNQETTEAMKRFIIVKGIDFLSVKAELWDVWKDERELLNIPIPESQAQGKFEFAMDMLVVIAEDFERLYTECTIAGFSGLTEEDAENYRQFFLSGMEGTRQENINRITKALFRNNGASLDIQPEVLGNRDSVDVQQMAERIQEIAD